MSACTLCPKRSTIECCSLFFCEPCIAQHITTITETKHSPMPSNLQRSHEITKAIHKKLCNELLELQEFRNSSLKVISGFGNELKLEIDSYISKFNMDFLQSCRKMQSDLELASQVLYTNNVRNPILDLFDKCESVESFQSISLIEKSFELPDFTISSVLEGSLSFEIKPCFVSLAKKDYFVKSKTNQIFERPQSDQLRMLARATSLTTAPNSAKFRVLDFSRPVTDTLYSVFPFTGKVFSYNMKDESKSEILLEKVSFPAKAAWTLTKDGKLVTTGGFYEAAAKTVFCLSLHNKRLEEYPKMTTGRFNHSQLTIDSYIYVFGGVNKTPLSECERFNLETKKWNKFSSLNVSRESPSSIHSLGKVYVAGGTGIESIECALLNSKKFDLLPLRLPVPGKVNLFFFDSQAIVLLKEKVLSIDFNSNTYKNIGTVSETCLWTSSDYHSSEFKVSWISEGRLVSFDVRDLTIRLTE